MNDDRSSQYMSAEELGMLVGRPPITRRNDGYEIVLSSAFDDAFTFFVTLPKARMSQAKGSAAPTEPE